MKYSYVIFVHPITLLFFLYTQIIIYYKCNINLIKNIKIIILKSWLFVISEHKEKIKYTVYITFKYYNIIILKGCLFVVMNKRKSIKNITL